MATYIANIPQLDPLASGANDNGAPAILVGDPLNDADVVAATRQHKSRKYLAEADPPQATPQEVSSSKRRKHIVESANFDGPTPLWAQQMQQQMQQMQQQMQQMQQQVQQQMQQMEQRLGWKIEQESQRSMNRSRRSTADAIVQLIRLTDGTAPGANIYFPENQVVLHRMTGQQVDDLLNFYGLDSVGVVGTRKERLQCHLGVTL